MRRRCGGNSLATFRSFNFVPVLWSSTYTILLSPILPPFFLRSSSLVYSFLVSPSGFPGSVWILESELLGSFTCVTSGKSLKDCAGPFSSVRRVPAAFWVVEQASQRTFPSQESSLLTEDRRWPVSISRVGWRNGFSVHIPSNSSVNPVTGPLQHQHPSSSAPHGRGWK